MGLLDNALQAIKNQYQETKGNVGLLMSDPRQYMSGLNQDAAEYNRLSSLALQAERNAYRGLPVSAEQIAAKQYIDQQQQDMALGFVGNIKPVGKAGLPGSGLEFDPRFDPRKLEQERLKNLKTVVEPTSKIEIPTVSLANYEGRPFVSSMSDRTAAGGNLVKINDVTLNRPVGLLGGQDYMFNNPRVWASAERPVKQIMKQAEIGKKITGQDPLLLQWRMAPSGGDFAHMTGETMLNYANASMSASGKKALDSDIKKFIPDWKGVDSDESISQFISQKDKVRKAIKKSLDKNFRNEGGLSIGEARLAVADPKQLTLPDAGIMNVGEIYAGQPIIQQSGHPSYPRGVPGQGLGRLEQQHNIFELLPNVVQARGIQNPTAPSQRDIRALQMKPYSGIITADLLKKLGY
jgi:hypothetical protein